eukprot:XP_001696012.1 flagellar associated protein [Chlamydomonas reinhardtii]
MAAQFQNPTDSGMLAEHPMRGTQTQKFFSAFGGFWAHFYSVDGRYEHWVMCVDYGFRGNQEVKREEKEGDNNDESEVAQKPGLEGAVFGVLFTLSQEKNTQDIFYHWVILKILLDVWQVYTQILTPQYGWDINPDSMLWKGVSVLSFGWLADIGYGWYVGLLYTLATLLGLNLALCGWVAVCFRNQKFDYVWPIKVVRGFSYVFLQVFDITSLNFLQLGISCNYTAPASSGLFLKMQLFPQYSCSALPQLAQAMASGVLLGVFVAVAMLVNMSEVEVNPTSKSPQALGHSGAEVTAFFIKVLMTLVSTFIGGWPKVASAAYLLLAFWLAWCNLRWVPHMVGWVGDLKSGCAVAMVGVAALQVAVVALPDSAIDARHTLTLVMGIGLAPLFVAGSLLSWWRRAWFTSAALKAFRTTDPVKVKPQDIFGFWDARDVEIAARSCRVWADRYQLDKAAVTRAQELIKAGVARFPGSSYVNLVYANFLLDVLGFSQTGGKQLEAARKLDPGPVCRFMLFVRQQQATQKAASSTVGKGGSMDLLGYVEYQRKQRMVLRHHKDALQAMANFWRILGYSSSVSFRSLSRSLEEIDTSVKQAEMAYRAVLEMYGNSPRLVRLYARFLETVKQDPWGAAEYSAHADRIEQNRDADGDGPTLPDGTPIGRMDEVDKGVLVVNAFGDIQMVNKKLMSMFGYRKGDLDGKNVTVLMAGHDAKRHPGLLRRYIDSGQQAPPVFRRPVLGMHRERVAIPVQLDVSRASGMGEDSVFIALLEAAPQEPGVGRLWATPEGLIVCCDAGFVTCFGLFPTDVVGTQLRSLLRAHASSAAAAAASRAAGQGGEEDGWSASKALSDAQKLVQRLISEAEADRPTSADGSRHGAPGSPGGASDGGTTARTDNHCFVRHKYDEAREVCVTVTMDPSRTILEFVLRLVSTEPQLLMVVEKRGGIKHMSGDLAKLLGASAGADEAAIGGGGMGGGVLEGLGAAAESAALRNLDDFLPAPWRYLHSRHLAKAIGTGVPASAIVQMGGGAPGAAGAGAAANNGAPALLSGMWGCHGGRTAGVDDGSPAAGGRLFRPTMRLVGLHGRPVFVRVAVHSREEGGEPLHVVRMARSSLDTAIAERRVRVRVSEAGTVIDEAEAAAAAAKLDMGPDVAADADEGAAVIVERPTTAAAAAQAMGEELEALFGFTKEELAGYHLWDFITLQPCPESELLLATAGATSGAGAAAATATTPRAGAVRRAAVTSTTMGAAATGAGALSRAVRHRLGNSTGVVGATSAKAAADSDATDTGGADGAVGGDLLEEAASVVYGEVGGVTAEEDAAAAAAAVADLAAGAMDAAANGSANPFASGPGYYGAGPPVEFNLRTFDAMITMALQYPGVSWRVAVVSPAAVAEAEAMGNASRAAAHLARNTRQAVLRLDVAVPRVRVRPRGGSGSPSGGMSSPRAQQQLNPALAPGRLVVHVELWAAESLTGVLELDPRGRVAGLAEEGGVRPAGLIFGQPSASFLGSELSQIVSMPAGYTPMTLLTGDVGGNAAKKSALKATKQQQAAADKEAAVKVGPVHYLPGWHRDGRPLLLAVQMVGKPLPPGGAQPASGTAGAAVAAAAGTVTAIIRLAPAGAQPSVLPPMMGAAATAGANALAAGEPSARSLGGTRRRASVIALPPPAAAPVSWTPIMGPGGSGNGSVQQMHLAKDLSRMGREATDAEAIASAAEGHAAAVISSLSAPAVSPLDPAAVGVAAAMPLPPPPLALAMTMPSPGITMRGSGPGAQGGTSSRPLAARSSKAREGAPGEAIGSGSGDSAGVLDSAVDLERRAHDGSTGADGGALSPPRSPASLPGMVLGDHDGRPSATGALGNAAAAVAAAKEAQGSGAALTKQPSNKISKWVSTNGEYYQNTVRSAPGIGGLEEEEEEEEGSDDDADDTSGSGVGDGSDQRGSGDGAASRRSARHPGGDEPAAVARLELAGAGDEGNGGKGAGARQGMSMAVDNSDTRSDGGESATSGVSGTSGLSDGDGTGDFKRGKRYKKLIKLIDSPDSKKSLRKFKMLVAAVIFTCMAVHVLCFALIMDGIHWQNDALQTLTNMGDGQRFLQKVAVYMRALDQTYRGKGSNNTYTEANAPFFASEMYRYLNLYNDMNNGILLNSRHQSITLLFYTDQLTVWVGNNSFTGEEVFTNVTTWDLLTRLLVAALTVYQKHEEWRANGTYPADTFEGQFVLRSAQQLAKGSQSVWVALQDHAKGHTQRVNNLQLIFLVIEGFLVSSCTAACLIYLLRVASEQRYKLYDTFLAIPIGLTRALASQTTHLLDDDESDDEEDEDGAAAAAASKAAELAAGDEHASVDGDAAGGGGAAAPKRRANFDNAGHGGSGGRRSGTGDLAADHPGSNNGGGKGSSVKGAKRKGGGRDAAAAAGEGNGASGPLLRMQSSMRDSGAGNGGASSWLSTLKAKILGRSNAVRDSSAPAKRSLERNSRVSIAMLAIAITYSILIITFYSVGYIVTLTTAQNVAMVAVAQRNMERVCEGVFFSQELLAQEDPLLVYRYIDELRSISVGLRDAYYTMRMGIDADRVAGPDIERFPGVVSHGLAKESPEQFDIFFGTGDCQRLNKPCEGPEYRYHEVTHAGVEAIIFQVVLSLKSLADKAEGAEQRAIAAVSHSTGVPIPTILAEVEAGLQDGVDGIRRITDLEISYIEANFQQVVVMHVVLFVLLVLVFAVFVFGLLMPMLKRMHKERRANFDNAGHGGSGGRRSGTGDLAADHPGSNNGGGKGSSVKGAKRKGGGRDAAAAAGEGNGASGPLLRMQSSMRDSGAGNGGASSWLSTLKAKILGRSNAVRDSSAPAKRSLERNSRVSIAMLAIAITYSILIITFYSVGYIVTLTTAQNVAMVAVAQRNMERACKAVFLSQELLAQEDPLLVHRYINELQNVSVGLRDAYYTMRMGIDADRVAGPDIERFPGVVSHGLAKESPEQFQLFFGTGDCQRLNAPCEGPEYRYYEVANDYSGDLKPFLTEVLIENMQDYIRYPAYYRPVCGQSALQFPGVSWRVAVVPPAAVAEAEAMGNASRAAAHLARNTRQAVLRLDVAVPRVRVRPRGGSGSPNGGMSSPRAGQQLNPALAPGRLVVHVELWAAESLTGVLELDPRGRVAGLAEEGGEAQGSGAALTKQPSNKISKWVSTNGEYYQNTVRSAPGIGGLEEEEEEEEGSDDDADDTSGSGVGDGSDQRGSGDGAASRRSARHPGGDEPAAVARLELAGAGDEGNGGKGAGARQGMSMAVDNSDTRSDGGESATSGVSGTSGLSDGDGTGDFKRGKRYKKLIKLIDSPDSKKSLRKFKMLVAAVIFTCMAVHVLCFALIMDGIHWQNDALQTLTNMGDGQRFLQKVAVYMRALDQTYRGKGSNNTYTEANAPVAVFMRALDQAYRGKGSNNTYTEANAPFFASEMYRYLNQYNDMNNGILLNSRHQSITLLFYTDQLTVWVGNNSFTGEEVFTNVTTWDLLTRLMVAGLTVYQKHEEWHAQKIYPADTFEGQFVFRSAQQLAKGSQSVWVALQDHAQGHTQRVNNLQLIFLVIEGFLVSSCTAACLIYLLRMASEQRYKLYDTFLAIPIGLTRALASQTTHLLDDDESDDEEDEDGAAAAAASKAAELAAGDEHASVDGDAAGGGGAAAPKRRANFDNAGHGGSGGRRSGTGDVAAADHPGSNNGGGKGASSVKDAKHRGGGGDAAAAAGGGNGASGPLLRMQSSMRDSGAGNGGASSWFGTLKAKILGRSNAFFASEMYRYLNLYNDMNNGILLNSRHQSITLLFYTDQLTVWVGNNSFTGEEVFTNVTTWDLLTRLLVAALTVYQKHEEWRANGTYPADTFEGQFVLRSAQQLAKGSQSVWVALQLIFLVIEGFLVSSCTAACLIYLLRVASEQRYKLYDTFLAIPIGLTRALASQTTHLLDDDESDDEEDEDGAAAAAASKAAELAAGDEHASVDGDAAGGGGAAAPKRRANFDNAGHGGSGGRRSGTGDVAAADHPGSNNGGGKGASSVKDAKHRGGGGDAAAAAGGGNGASGPLLRMQSSMRDSGAGNGGASSWFGTLKAKILGRSNAVRDSSAPAKRSLERNSRVSIAMLAIAITYSILIITFYSVGYILTLTTAQNVAMVAVAQRNMERACKAVFLSQELLAQEDPLLVHRYINELQNVSVGLRDAYYTMRMGIDADRVAGPDIERFPGVVSHGLAKESPEQFQLFFGTGDCQRLNAPCEGPEYRYYEVTHGGVEAIIFQVVLSVKSLADQAQGAEHRAIAAVSHSVGVPIETILAEVQAEVVVMHVVLFILLVAVFVVFVFGLLMPMLKRMHQEKRRITEMLSQLPTEVDVMKLITLVIMGSSPVANDKSVKGVAEGGKSVRRSSVLGSGGVAVNASAANNAQATQRSSTMELPAGGGGGAAADDGDMGVADSKAWKGLLARATSVKGGGSFASPKRV